MQARLNTDIRVTVVGLGYVGLTLASVLARHGFMVHGIDVDPGQVEAIRAGRPRFFEPGLVECLERHLDRNLFVGERHGATPPDVAILAVSTPVDATGHGRLEHLRSAIADLLPVISPETLVILRSTVPVGTTRRDLLAPLESRFGAGRIRVAFCPERTIQGQALQELETLPQIVGGIDAESSDLAAAFFGRFARRVVPLSSPEAAEMTKLVNNAHTDLLYAFANELAGRAESHGIDPLEVIHGANFEYPRPRIALPGFVGGGCLSKDPYLLLEGEGPGRESLVRLARETNEEMPAIVARRLSDSLRRLGKNPKSARILLCGIAYKGVPPTDDLRGNPAEPLLQALGNRRAPILGHDFLVPADKLRGLGLEPVELEDGFRDADAVVFLNNHRGYREIAESLPFLCSTASTPVVLFDCWRIFDCRREGSSGIAIETGTVGPSKYAGSFADTAVVDPRTIPGVIYQSIGLPACALSSPAAPVF